MKFSFLLILLLSSHAWAKWSVSTYNIRNFDKDPGSGQTNIAELGKIIKSVQSDVMAFEEVVNRTAFDSLIKQNLPGYAYQMSNCGGFGKQNLAVVYNPKVFEFMSTVEDLSFSGSNNNSCGSLRPALLVTLMHIASKKIYTFGAVHLKAGGDNRAMSQRWKQYQNLGGLVKKYAAQNLILLGDFNTTGYNLQNEDYQRFEDMLSGTGVRTMAENIGCTNYWKGTQGGAEFQPSILDHIVLQDKNVAQVMDVRVGAHCAMTDCRPATPQNLGVSYQSVSDHCPVQVTFR
ncbi:endonuclease/exonuclease/phosphatase family protein [Peredibacter starrii]|uniref:Endonuclease/exonuclease/phosphatase family protein n=1 Tax=Peredibacter starrii TaxID=28202 RepID=A0AAX4HNW8_9BACT|nr:endonuclease/exonuclease/phosphatase family protein [Peredibacter starrii]WPU64853.1 endonuclease/exonuclease/phosphatase family protein [Peredibacter starrii]